MIEWIFIAFVSIILIGYMIFALTLNNGVSSAPRRILPYPTFTLDSSITVDNPGGNYGTQLSLRSGLCSVTQPTFEVDNGRVYVVDIENMTNKFTVVDGVSGDFFGGYAQLSWSASYVSVSQVGSLAVYNLSPTTLHSTLTPAVGNSSTVVGASSAWSKNDAQLIYENTQTDASTWNYVTEIYPEDLGGQSTTRDTIRPGLTSMQTTQNGKLYGKDGDTLVEYTWINGTYLNRTEILDDCFTFVVSDNGTYLTSYDGDSAIHVFVNRDGTWQSAGTVSGVAEVTAMAMTQNGGYVAVAFGNSDTVHVYFRGLGDDLYGPQIINHLGGGDFGTDVALSHNESGEIIMMVGAPASDSNKGVVYKYTMIAS